jgi:hypothetical protein
MIFFLKACSVQWTCRGPYQHHIVTGELVRSCLWRGSDMKTAFSKSEVTRLVAALSLLCNLSCIQDGGRRHSRWTEVTSRAPLQPLFGLVQLPPHSWPFLPRWASSSPTTSPPTPQGIQSSLCPPLILLLEPVAPSLLAQTSTSHGCSALPSSTHLAPDRLSSLNSLPLLPLQSKHKRRDFCVLFIAKYAINTCSKAWNLADAPSVFMEWYMTF